METNPMKDDVKAVRTIDEYLSLALTADSDAPAATLAHVHAALTAPGAAAVLRTADGGAAEGVLGALPAATHTLGRLCVLAAPFAVPESAAWASAVEATLAAAVPAHLLAALPTVCAVVHRHAALAALAVRGPRVRAARAAAALADSVLARLAAAGLRADVLTPVHTDALALRLAAGDVGGALPLAQRTFAAAHAPAHHAAAVLAFDYYAGVVCAAAGDFVRALACFERVCRAPALTPPSWIALCAYRKYVLVALAVHGALPADAPAPRLPQPGRRARAPLPGHGSHGGSSSSCEGRAGVCAVAVQDTHVALYQELAAHVGALRVCEARAFLQAHAAELRADGNLGLARRVEESLLRHVVRRMGTVFAACTLADMLAAAHLPATDAPALAAAVRALEHDGSVPVAFADAAGTVVRFGASTPAAASADVCTALTRDIRATLATTHALDAARDVATAAAVAIAAAAGATAPTVVDDDVLEECGGFYRDDDDDDDDDDGRFDSVMV